MTASEDRMATTKALTDLLVSQARLEESVRMMAMKLDQTGAMIDQDRQKTEEHREAIQREMAAVHAAATTLSARVDHVEPIARVMQSWRAQVIGAMTVLGVLGGFILTVLGLFKEQLARLFHGG